DRLTDASRSADREDGKGQPPGLALLVLRDGGVERAVELETAAQGSRDGREGVDVVPDGVVGQLLDGLGGVLPAEEDVFPSPDKLLVHLGKPVEGDVPEPV